MLFNPYSEPENDPYGLNEHGVDKMMVLMGAVPLVGIAVIFGSMGYAILEGKHNDYNLANEAWNTGIVSLVFQVLYLVVFTVIA